MMRIAPMKYSRMGQTIALALFMGLGFQVAGCNKSRKPTPIQQIQKGKFINLTRGDIIAIFVNNMSSASTECTLRTDPGNLGQGIDKLWVAVAKHIINVKYAAGRHDTKFFTQADKDIAKALGGLAPNQRAEVIKRLAAALKIKGTSLLDRLSASEKRDLERWCDTGVSRGQLLASGFKLFEYLRNVFEKASLLDIIKIVSRAVTRDPNWTPPVASVSRGTEPRDCEVQAATITSLPVRITQNGNAQIDVVSRDVNLPAQNIDGLSVSLGNMTVIQDLSINKTQNGWRFKFRVFVNDKAAGFRDAAIRLRGSVIAVLRKVINIVSPQAIDPPRTNGMGRPAGMGPAPMRPGPMRPKPMRPKPMRPKPGDPGLPPTDPSNPT